MTKSFSARAAAISDAWPSCSAPMVGTNPIVRPSFFTRRTSSRSSAVVFTTCNIKKQPPLSRLGCPGPGGAQRVRGPQPEAIGTAANGTADRPLVRQASCPRQQKSTPENGCAESPLMASRLDHRDPSDIDSILRFPGDPVKLSRCLPVWNRVHCSTPGRVAQGGHRAGTRRADGETRKTGGESFARRNQSFPSRCCFSKTFISR